MDQEAQGPATAERRLVGELSIIVTNLLCLLRSRVRGGS